MMPKEITYEDTKPFVRTPAGDEFRLDHPDCPEQTPDGANLVLRRGVKVGWSKDQFVEVGVAAFEASTEGAVEGTYLTLDRTGINRLIRSLRKARDQAFGADA